MNNFVLSNYTNKLVLAAMVSLLMGCETYPEKSALEQNFGSSVRAMIEQQTAKPDVETFGLNGQKGEAVRDIYVKDVAKPEKVEQDIIKIELGK